MRITRFAICTLAVLPIEACREPIIPETIAIDLEPVTAQTSGVVGELADHVPSVRVRRESDGSPVSRVVIEFRLGGQQQNGVLGARLDTTDALGFATAGSWRLGTNAGTQTVIAYAFAQGRTTGITALARAGPASMVNAAVSRTQYTLDGRQPLPPSVRVADKYNNSISGIGVTFATAANGGEIGITSATTGTNGTASSLSWTLPAAVGTYSASALVSGTPDITFTAQRVDSSSLAWYSLDSISFSGAVTLPAAWNIKGARLGLSKFDVCLCVPFDGHFFNIIDYEGTTSPRYETSGATLVAGGKLSLNGEEVLTLTTNTLKLKHYDYYYSATTWTYSRKN